MDKELIRQSPLILTSLCLLYTSELVSLIKSEVEKLSVGSPEDNATIVPLIDEQSADFVQGLIDDALEKGATLVLGNKREENLIYPTLLDHVTKEMRIAWEEPFGPVLPIIRVNSKEEAMEIANASEYGLQARVFTDVYKRQCMRIVIKKNG